MDSDEETTKVKNEIPVVPPLEALVVPKTQQARRKSVSDNSGLRRPSIRNRRGSKAFSHSLIESLKEVNEATEELSPIHSSPRMDKFRLAPQDNYLSVTSQTKNTRMGRRRSSVVHLMDAMMYTQQEPASASSLAHANKDYSMARRASRILNQDMAIEQRENPLLEELAKGSSASFVAEAKKRQEEEEAERLRVREERKQKKSIARKLHADPRVLWKGVTSSVKLRGLSLLATDSNGALLARSRGGAVAAGFLKSLQVAAKETEEIKDFANMPRLPWVDKSLSLQEEAESQAASKGEPKSAFGFKTMESGLTGLLLIHDPDTVHKWVTPNIFETEAATKLGTDANLNMFPWIEMWNDECRKLAASNWSEMSLKQLVSEVLYPTIHREYVEGNFANLLKRKPLSRANFFPERSTEIAPIYEEEEEDAQDDIKKLAFTVEQAIEEFRKRNGGLLGNLVNLFEAKKAQAFRTAELSLLGKVISPQDYASLESRLKDQRPERRSLSKDNIGIASGQSTEMFEDADGWQVQEERLEGEDSFINEEYETGSEEETYEVFDEQGNVTGTETRKRLKKKRSSALLTGARMLSSEEAFGDADFESTLESRIRWTRSTSTTLFEDQVEEGRSAMRMKQKFRMAISPEERLKALWDGLELSLTQRLAMLRKYTLPEYASQFSAALAAWERAAIDIARRDAIMDQIILFESTGAHPWRLFSGRSQERLKEEAVRKHFRSELKKATAAASHSVQIIKDRFGDIVYVRGQPYRIYLYEDATARKELSQIALEKPEEDIDFSLFNQRLELISFRDTRKKQIMQGLLPPINANMELTGDMRNFALPGSLLIQQNIWHNPSSLQHHQQTKLPSLVRVHEESLEFAAESQLEANDFQLRSSKLDHRIRLMDPDKILRSKEWLKLDENAARIIRASARESTLAIVRLRDWRYDKPS